MDPNEYWLRVLLPVSSAIVAAISAILLYRFTHRHSLRSNAERWLDCVRDDVAELVALHLMVVRLGSEGGDHRTVDVRGLLATLRSGPAGASGTEGDEREREKQRREWEKQREMLQVRLRLRLTKRTKSHERLLDRVGEFLATRTGPEADEVRDDVVEAACGVVDETWRRIRSGYIRR